MADLSKAANAVVEQWRNKNYVDAWNTLTVEAHGPTWTERDAGDAAAVTAIAMVRMTAREQQKFVDWLKKE